MKVYLARHGEALPNEMDPQNGLSEAGRNAVKELGKFLGLHKLPLAYIFHSTKLRARQTAEIFAKELRFHGVVEERDGLEPNDLVGPIASEINQSDEDALYVGHLPFMGKLASRLLSGNEHSDLVAFQTATIICLENVGGSSWILKWALCPELVTET